MSYLEDGKGQQSQSSPAETPLAKTVLWLHITLRSCFTRLCVAFFVKAVFNENQCGTRQAALNKETQLPGKKVLEALDSSIRFPSARIFESSWTKEATSQAGETGCQNVAWSKHGGHLNIKSGTRAAPAAQV